LGFIDHEERYLEIQDGFVHSTSFRAHLLDPEGACVPPGEYDVRVRYASYGNNGTRGAWSRNGSTSHDAFRGRRIWEGTLESAPLRMRIVDRGPLVSRCKLPTAARLESDGSHQFRWMWTEWESVDLASRPGFALGIEYGTVFVEGAPRSADSRVPDGVADSLFSARPAFLGYRGPPPGRAFVCLRIYESSHPATRRPEHYDHRVLDQRAFEVPYPD
jgi:hypothetical protein